MVAGDGPGPAPPARTVGPATVVAVEDSVGAFFRPRTEAFPGAADAQWRRTDRYDPGAGRDGRWLLRFRGYAVRMPDGATVLVDAGVGPPGSPASRWAPAEGRLPRQLAAAGIDPDDVTTVVLTHLHDDHVGWAVVEQRPFFTHARYVLQRVEHDRIGEATRRRLLAPLRATGQLSLVDGGDRPAPGVRVVPTPGHTPGHQSVLVEAGGDTVAITGDLLVHMMQLLHPEVGYAYESDPDLARRSREELLAELTARGATLATAHLTEPFLVLPVV